MCSKMVERSKKILYLDDLFRVREIMNGRHYRRFFDGVEVSGVSEPLIAKNMFSEFGPFGLVGVNYNLSCTPGFYAMDFVDFVRKEDPNIHIAALTTKNGAHYDTRIHRSTISVMENIKKLVELSRRLSQNA
jgi:hypothetical protein